MFSLESTQVIPLNFSAEEDDEILQNLRVLFTTVEGTVPFDRTFGIDTSILDEPIPVAKGLLMVEYIDKAKIYEPRISIEEVNFEVNNLSGLLIPKVVITRES